MRSDPQLPCNHASQRPTMGLKRFNIVRMPKMVLKPSATVQGDRTFLATAS
jgi:hypothetical protein